MTSLADEFPHQQARVRDLLTEYKAIGPAGMFGTAMIEQVLQRADKAAAEGDVVAMIVSFKEMKEVE